MWKLTSRYILSIQSINGKRILYTATNWYTATNGNEIWSTATNKIKIDIQLQQKQNTQINKHGIQQHIKNN